MKKFIFIILLTLSFTALGVMTYPWNASACDIEVDIGSGTSGTATGKVIWDIDYKVFE